MQLNDLCKDAFPKEIYETWRQSGISEALPVQRAAVEAGIFVGRPLLVVAPTSSGKTFLGEMLALGKAVSGSRAIYLVPFKAIAEERFSEFVSRYSNNPTLGFRCIVSDRDHHESDSDLLNGKYDIAILTYEKLAALLVTNQAILDTCGAVIVDEIQLVSDEGRGPGLELLLTKLRNLTSSCQFLGLSAVLGDLNKFDEWIGCSVIRENARPVELRAGIVSSNGAYEYGEANSGKKGSEQLVSNSLPELIEAFVKADEQVLVFANSVRRTTELAQNLAAHLGLPAATNAIKQLNDEADTETRELLLKTLRHGVAFHNADCELPERLIVEQAFRAGEIRALVSTTTLSMGVNLPVDNVVLADNQRWTVIAGSFTQVPWRNTEVRNILGRAGRFGKSKSFGRGLLLAANQAEVIQCRRLYFDSAIEPLKSALGERDVDQRVLTVIASGYAQTKQEVHTFLFDTFAGRTWSIGRPQITELIDQGIKECEALELIEIRAGDKVQTTRLGCVCAGNHLALDSFAALKKYVLDVVSFDALDASFAAASVDEVKSSIQRIRWDDAERNFIVRTALSKQHSESKLVGYIQRVFSFLMEKPSQKHNPELTIASVCRSVLETEEPMRALCAAFKISGSNLRQMCENVAWMVDAMSAISRILRPEFELQFNELASCLKKRAPFSCRYLGDLPSYVGRDERIRLREKGVASTEEFLDLVPTDLAGIMSPAKADRCMKTLELQRTRSYDYWKRDHTRRLNALGFNHEIVIKLYSETGLNLETAIETLFNTGFAKCHAQRISEQRSGEPDLLLLFDSGARLTVQITAKENNRKYVDSKKAGDVIPQSARFKADGFICIGRPDFETLAREQAGHLGLKYNYKQLPLFVLAEAFVLVKEGRLAADGAEQFVKSEKGYLSLDKLRTANPVVNHK